MAWYSVSGRYGGGGVGGGEPQNDTFIEPSNGGTGQAFMLKVGMVNVEYTDKFLVEVEKKRHKICSLRQPQWLSCDSIGSSKMHISYDLPIEKVKATRRYALNPLSINSSDPYIELADITNFHADIGLVASKITHENIPLNVMYSKSDNESNLTYFTSIEGVESAILHGNYKGTLESLHGTTNYYVLLQAGGGGGGGADNTWGLFNYAAGGGGGGAGGACCYRITVCNASYQYELNVGEGGAAGKNKNYGTVGENGGSTSLIVKDENDTVVAQITVSGGTGGTGGVGNDGGLGGAGGKITSVIDHLGILNKICEVEGGAGGNANNAGKNVVATGAFTEKISSGLFDATFNADKSFGDPGELIGADDRGGTGGASWLGWGGYYSPEQIVTIATGSN